MSYTNRAKIKKYDKHIDPKFGTPVYQAPEIYVGSEAGITIAAYKMMDIWFLAMIVFELLNPHTYAYKSEILDAPACHSIQSFPVENHKNRMLPWFSVHFQELQQGEKSV